MSDRDPEQQQQSARLLRLLIWTGVGLAPIAAIVVLVGGSGGALRFAVLLVAVCVVLIGASMLIRNDPVLLRIDVEDRVAAEVDALRGGLREEIASAARATGHRVQVLEDEMTRLRADGVPPSMGAVSMTSPAPMGAAAMPGPAASAPAPRGAARAAASVSAPKAAASVSAPRATASVSAPRATASVSAPRATASVSAPRAAASVSAPQAPRASASVPGARAAASVSGAQAAASVSGPRGAAPMSASGFPRQRGAASVPVEPYRDEPVSGDLEPRRARRHAAPDTGTDLARFGYEAGDQEPDSGAYGYGLTTGGIAPGGTYDAGGYEQAGYETGGTYGAEGYDTYDKTGYAEPDYDPSGFTSEGSYDYGGDRGFGYGRATVQGTATTYGAPANGYTSARGDRYDDDNLYGADPRNMERADHGRW